jgi:hypothetical protein
VLISQQGREEIVGKESGREMPAEAKDADETTTHHTTTHLTHVPPAPTDTNLEILPPFCMPVVTTETESKSPLLFAAGLNGERRKNIVGMKRKSKHGGGGGKHKHSKRMMP